MAVGRRLVLVALLCLGMAFAPAPVLASDGAENATSEGGSATDTTADGTPGADAESAPAASDGTADTEAEADVTSETTGEAEEATAEAEPTEGNGANPELTAAEETIAKQHPAFLDIVFPVAGVSAYSDTFGACRDGCARSHEGADIMTYGWKGVPVVAAIDGRIVWANVGGRLAGCGIVIQNAEGWRVVYSHLNTDTPGTDDGEYSCFAPSVEVGKWVSAGTLIGWVGDAGNAEETSPHLHFEIRDPDGEAINPTASLKAASRIAHRWITTSDLIDVTTHLHKKHQHTVYVVAAEDFDRIAHRPEYAERFGDALIPYSEGNAIAAHAAIRAFEPETIVVLAEEAPRWMEALRSLAPIVERSSFLTPPPLVADEAPNEASLPLGMQQVASEAVNPHLHEAVGPRFTTVIAGGNTSRGPGLGALWDTTPVITLAGRAPSMKVGVDGMSKPDKDANRNVLWWLTADGWLMTESMDAAPHVGVAFATTKELDEWTLAFLASLAEAPQMPLWHFQPTEQSSQSL